MAELQRRVFRIADHPSQQLLDDYRRYFNDVLLKNPWSRDDATSLVYEEEGGKITGFLAVAPRRMLYRGRAIRARIASQYAVEPGRRGFPGLKLLKALLDGPQDLTIADEATPGTREIWVGMGGSCLLHQSLHWMYPLRPFKFLQWIASKKLAPARLAHLVSPFARAMDVCAQPFVKKFSGVSAPDLSAGDLTPEALIECVNEQAKVRSLVPDYDPESLSWVLRRLAGLTTSGALQRVLVRQDSGHIAGWYIYHANPEGFSQVVQFHADPGFGRAVFDHLVQHAAAHGVSVLKGRLEPGLAPVLSERHCLLHCGPEWSLIHSKHPDILEAVNRGDAWISKLEGEWSLRFH